MKEAKTSSSKGGIFWIAYFSKATIV